MNCRLPPPLTDEVLMRALDGEADAAAQQHLADCPGCTARLERIREFEMQLEANLSRQSCCTPDELSDYALGLAEEQQRVQAHLATCANCRAELDDFRAFMEKSDDPTPVAAIKPAASYRKAPVLERWTVQPLPGTAPAVRGKINRVIAAEADEGRIQIVVEVEPDANGVKLSGAVMADNQTEWAYALLTVMRRDDLLALATLNPDGAFTCGPFPASPFNLQVTARNGATLVLENIE